MFGNLFGAKKTTFDIRIESHDLSLTAPRGKTILATALQAGLPFPHDCKVGSCGTCKCKLLEGKVSELSNKTIALTGEEVQGSYILACQSIPKTDVRIALDHLSDAPFHRLQSFKGEIGALHQLTHDIVEMTVNLDEEMAYTAGQYADISTSEIGGIRSYSFASPPLGEARNTLTFHIRHVAGGEFTDWLCAADRTGHELKIDGPYGGFYLRPANAPILCIAGGSGMAPLKALLQEAHWEGCAREVVYLYGARSQQDLYCVDEMRQLSQDWKGSFRFVPVLSEEPAGSDWAGASGLVTQHITTQKTELARCHVYMCGPPPMIDAAETVLRQHGVAAEHIYADRFLDKRYTSAASPG